MINKTFATLIIPITFLFITVVCNAADEDPSETTKLHKIFNEEWKWELKQNPFMTSYTGDPRYADQLPNRSLNAIELRRKHVHEVRVKLDAINYANLPNNQKLNFDLFKLNNSLDIEGQKFRDKFMPVTQMGGIHSEITRIAKIVPKRTVKNVEDLITRLTKYPELVGQTIVLM